jgi:hypothetical protein
MHIQTITGRSGILLLSGLLFVFGCGNDSSDKSDVGSGNLLLADGPTTVDPAAMGNGVNEPAAPTDGAGGAALPTPTPSADGTPNEPADGEMTPMADPADGLGDGSGDGMGAGSDGMVGNGAMVNPLPNDCSRQGFQGAREIGRRTQDGFAYVSLTSEQAPYDAFQLATLGSFNGPMAPGVYSLDGINYADCGLCLLIEMGCGNPQEPCAKTFYADAGSVELTAIGGDQFAGKLTNVVFREVTVDEEFRSTPVAGGETWCLGEYAFDVQLDAEAGGGAPAMGNDGPTGDVANPANCDDPTLACIGEEIQDFSLTNCGTGMPQSMNEYFNGMKGGWYVLTAGWCPACTRFIPSVIDVMENPAVDGKVKAAFILGEDTRQNPPTLEYCRRYGMQKNIPLENLFMDHDGTNSFGTLFQYVWPYIVNGSFGLPFNALFEADTMLYIYADRASPTDDINAALNRLLR